MRDELLAGLSPLVGVTLAGESESVTDLVQVDRLDRVLRVLGDDREEVRQQVPLLREKILVPLGDERGLRLAAVPIRHQADADPRGRKLSPALGGARSPISARAGRGGLLCLRRAAIPAVLLCAIDRVALHGLRIVRRRCLLGGGGHGLLPPQAALALLLICAASLRNL